MEKENNPLDLTGLESLEKHVEVPVTCNSAWGRKKRSSSVLASLIYHLSH